MRLVHLVLAAAIATVAGCMIVERTPGADPAAGALAGAGKGAAIGAPLGPWGELVGGALGAIVGAGSAYHVGRRHGKQAAKEEAPGGLAAAR